MPASMYVGAKMKLLSTIMEDCSIKKPLSKFHVTVSSSDGIVASCIVKIKKSNLKMYKAHMYCRSQKVLDLPLTALNLRFDEENRTVDFNHANAKWRTVPDTRLRFDNYMHFIIFLRQFYAATGQT